MYVEYILTILKVQNMINDNKTKRCSKCNRELPLTAFYTRKKGNELVAVTSECKECRTLYVNSHKGQRALAQRILRKRLKEEVLRLKTLEKDNPQHFKNLGIVLPCASKMSLNIATVDTYKRFCFRIVDLNSSLEYIKSLGSVVTITQEELSVIEQARDKLVSDFKEFIRVNKRKSYEKNVVQN